jgi:glycogen debranching enzyme
LTTALLLASSSLTAAQGNWESAPAFPLADSPWVISRPAQPRMPFTVAGEAGAVFGQGDGSFEAWVFPVKIASHFRITAELAGYPIPIELSDYASTITVNPDRTTITYSHAAFTVKQHMFSSRGPNAAGPVIFFEIASVRPLTLTFRFTADMLRMWPAANFGLPSAEWVSNGPSGYYVLHTDNPDFSGSIGIPGAVPGIMAPYQERPRTYPLELKLSFDPKTQSRRFFPLMISSDKSGVLELNRTWTQQFRQTADYYAHFFDSRLTVETPDPKFDLAMRWAELAIDQAQVSYHGETALAAGYYSSADSARPGFGWFFGRDTLFTLYAINSYGDPALSRKALEFLLRRQRADGKIMHEFSQTAPLVNWVQTPYFYASADATPLLIMSVWDYVRSSGDVDFLSAHWPEVKKAWEFTRAHDSDGDGIYENTEGTGWVESWPPGMPHQEVYLAALDQQACTAFSRLAGLMQDAALEARAGRQAAAIAGKIASEYYDPARQFYAFSRNADGSLDETATAFPTIAWWDGTLQLPLAGKMFERLASPEFSTDWGIRDVSRNAALYDPISYHQGSVWPLYTGWTSLAEYRAGRPFAGYAHLMQNADMTFSQDLGAVTELLSGEFFQPFGRSSSHQLWSSAMVIVPAVRGMFGIEEDALKHILRIHPQLPAEWETAIVHNLHNASGLWDLTFQKSGTKLRIEAKSAQPQLLCLTAGADCTPTTARIHNMELDLPLFEVELPHALPPPGSSTTLCKIISKTDDSFDVEGMAGSEAQLAVRFARAPAKVTGAVLSQGKLIVRFAEGEGYVRARIGFTW